MIELKVLQAVRLKGRVHTDDVQTTLDEEADAVAEAIRGAVDAGYLIQAKALRLSPAGRNQLEALLAAERSGVDHVAISALYDDFRSVNHEFKQLVSEWQVKDGQPNAHDDAEYDLAILTRLSDIDDRVGPILDEVTARVPRLSNYRQKLTAALDKLRAGDTAWLTRPIVDSYHTVWFELHEELILAAGLTREDEARAGHAQ